MKDADDEAETLRQLIQEEVEKCTDVNLLDLIYKLLIL